MFLMIISVLVAKVALNQTFKKDLLLYYPINQDANDHSGHGFHGKPLNGCTLEQDRFDKENSAYNLDGINDVIYIDPKYKIKPQFPISVSFWINVDVFPNGYNFGIFTNDYVENYYTGIWVGLLTTHKIGMGYGNGGGVSSSNRRSRVSDVTIESNTWYHIVTVFDSPDDLKIFINNEEVSGSYSGGYFDSISYSDQPGYIGLKDFNITPGYFNGQIDQISFWTKTLNTEEIDSLYQDPFDSPETENKSTSGINTYSNSQKLIIIYPNPSTEGFNIKLSREVDSPYHLLIYNSNGKIVKHLNEVNTSELLITDIHTPGIYFYIISTKSGEISKGKIIVN